MSALFRQKMTEEELKEWNQLTKLIRSHENIQYAFKYNRTSEKDEEEANWWLLAALKAAVDHMPTPNKRQMPLR